MRHGLLSAHDPRETIADRRSSAGPIRQLIELSGGKRIFEEVRRRTILIRPKPTVIDRLLVRGEEPFLRVGRIDGRIEETGVLSRLRFLFGRDEKKQKADDEHRHRAQIKLQRHLPR